MGDRRRAVVPYHDPQDGPSLDQQRLLEGFHDEPAPDMSDIYAGPDFPPAEYYNNNTHFPQQQGMGAEPGGSGSGAVPGDPTMFLIGSMLREGGGPAGFTHGSSSSQGAGPSGSNDHAGPSNTQNTNFNIGRALPQWPMPPEPYKCSCCQVLREIIHVNDYHLTKLELHGRIGLISHAILETRQGFDAEQEGTTYQMIDFLKKGLDDVRQYLWGYCEEKSLTGYQLIPDTLSTYYEAVCVGLIWDDVAVDELEDYFEAYPQNPPEAAQEPPPPPPNGPPPPPPDEPLPPPPNEPPPPPNVPAPPPNEPPPPPNGPPPPPNGPENAPPADQQQPPPPHQQPQPVRNNPPALANPPAQNNPNAGNQRGFLALQRERVANMSLMDLAPFFHLRIDVAAIRLNLCPTVVKRLCRRHGIKRWPYRKIRSIKKLIEKIQGRLRNQNEQERQASRAEIAALRQRMEVIRHGVPEAAD